jgi:spore coat protein U-like protein
MKSSKKLIAAAVAGLAMFASSAAQASDTHTINVSATVTGVCKFVSAGPTNVSLTLDPTATSGGDSQPAVIQYRCTKNTAPVFTVASTSTGSSTGGELRNGGEAIVYAIAAASGGAGDGMGAGAEKDLTVTVSANHVDAANVPAGSYTDTITIDISN